MFSNDSCYFPVRGRKGGKGGRKGGREGGREEGREGGNTKEREGWWSVINGEWAERKNKQ